MCVEFGDQCRFSIYGEGSRTVVHDATIVIDGSQGIHNIVLLFCEIACPIYQKINNKVLDKTL